MSDSPASMDIQPQRLFVSICFALVSTAVAFAVVSDLMKPWKEQFILTNQQVGYIGGASLWGFTLSIFIVGPLCDVLGMRLLLRLAFVGHVAAVAILYIAAGFWMLFFGSLAIGIANGFVEAAGNPLVATLFPDRKVEKMNKFHVWFPGGIMLGGVAAYLLNLVSPDQWRLKLFLILVPTLVYGLLFVGQRFPATERVQTGVSAGQMLRATFLRPLFWLLVICMMMTASVELGPNRWMPAVLGAVGISGILLLGWINGLMGLMRYFAGPALRRLRPTGLLLVSVIVSGLGLWWLSYATTTLTAYLSGTVFAIGVSYIWPTMLGITAERVPHGGALALAIMAGTGGVITGFVTAPQMGRIGDRVGHDMLDAERARVVLRQVAEQHPELVRPQGKSAVDMQVAADLAREVLADADAADGALPPIKTANALRMASQLGGDSPVTREADDILGPAENYGGRVSFRYVASLNIILVILFGWLYLRDRAAGGFPIEHVGPKAVE